jgi:uncharacterized protein (TIGR01777 family)
MPASADELYAWHARPGAFQRLQPPWETIRMVDTEGAFGTDGYRVEFRTSLLGPIKGTWRAEAYDFQPGVRFQDRQLKGPFAFWNHTHSFIPDGPQSSFLEEHVEYRVPGGALGRVLTGRMVRKRLEAMFRYRHALTASDLRRHAKYPTRLKIAVTGSRGLVGSELVLFLLGGGHAVTRLVSGDFNAPNDGTTWVRWNAKEPLDPAVLAGHDAVIHLAGDGVADGRWNAAKKKRVLESRTIPTRHLADAIAALPSEQRPKVLVSASAVGFYGDRWDELLTEESSAGTGFLADVCREWEAAAEPAAQAGVRVVHPRIGIVLTPKGAALGKQLLPFKMGVGAVLGSGKQWQPWVTINDLVGVLHEGMMNHSLSGPVIAAAPNPVPNREFTKTIGRVLRRPAFFWLPRVALRVLFGEVADGALLASMRTTPTKLLAAGFAFDHAELEPALRFLLGK